MHALFMHALHVLKQACLEALSTENAPGNPALFFSIVDPGSVLELVKIAETRITDEEVQALHQVITELGNYIRRTSPTPEAMVLLLHAKQIVGITTQ
jgi:hypothetical protein